MDTEEAFEITRVPAALMLGSGILEMCPAWCLEEHVLFCFVSFHFDWNILPCWYLVLTFPASMSALFVFALVGQKEAGPAHSHPRCCSLMRPRVYSGQG